MDKIPLCILPTIKAQIWISIPTSLSGCCPGENCRSSSELGFSFVSELHRECHLLSDNVQMSNSILCNMGLSENRLQEIHPLVQHDFQTCNFGVHSHSQVDPSLKAEDVSGHDSNNFECDAHKR